ncbi:hypothetical protein COB55_05900 [Candidatus Wolfebacteria bacterium]|nr:MAG: hypothetical protein COB55_05900 [Candidatus Wolfebacteria bacterium]
MNIGIWGDSIVYGQGDSEALGWVGRLRKKLNGKERVEVYNFGVCGDTAVDISRRFRVEVDSMDPDIIVFAFGMNDEKYLEGEDTNNVPLEEFNKILNQLINDARKFTSKIFLVGVTRVDDAMETLKGNRFVNKDIKRYNESIKEIANAQKLTFIDMFNVLNPDTDLADGLHPNSDGYEKMFDVISKKIIIE